MPRRLHASRLAERRLEGSRALKTSGERGVGIVHDPDS
jgi:hypothetical protein